MARGGQNRKSKTRAKREGTARKDRHVDPIVIAEGEPVMPAWLSKEAQEAWREFVPMLAKAKVIEKVDGLGLAQLFEAYVLARQAREHISSPVIEVTRYSAQGDEWIELQKHPAMGAWKDAVTVLRGLLSDYGMQPLARMKLGDALSTPGEHGPQLPGGAPAAFIPQVVKK